MGINIDSYGSIRTWHRSILSFGALLVLSLAPVHGKSQGVDARKLAETIRNIDNLIARHSKESTMYRMRRRMLMTDFGVPIASWRRRPGYKKIRPGLLSENAFSTNLRKIIFYAVCRKKSRALKKVYEVNKLIAGGIFLQIEIEYLQRLAQQEKLKLDFRKSFSEFNSRRSGDLRYETLKRNMIAAFEDGRPQVALRFASGFESLCKAR